MCKRAIPCKCQPEAMKKFLQERYALQAYKIEIRVIFNYYEVLSSWRELNVLLFQLKTEKIAYFHLCSEKMRLTVNAFAKWYHKITFGIC